MARLLFPDEGSRLGYRVVATSLRSVAGSTATLFTDAAGTTLADIRSYDGTATPGPVIPGSTVSLDSYSRLPLFWGPDLLVDTLWADIYGGPLSPVLARFDPRIDTLDAAVAALQPGVGPFLVKTQNLADLPNPATARTSLGLGTAATQNVGAFDAAGAAAAAQSASQPLDSDLTAIAALTTTAYGRAFLALADATAARTALALGSAALLTTNTPRITTIVSSATPTLNTDVADALKITALATDVTSFTTNLTGTPADMAKLLVRVTDDGVARNLAWGAKFAPGTTALPTVTVASKQLTVGFIYGSTSATWQCVASGSQP